MSEPMTEGAKTGAEIARKYRGQAPSREEIEEWIMLAGGLQDTLTEALKVAGELAEAALALADLAERNTDDTDEWEAAIGSVRSLSALERIRNQSEP